MPSVMPRRRRTAVAFCSAMVISGSVLSGVGAVPAQAADRCHGAPVPAGYTTAGGVPASLHSPAQSLGKYNPQGISLFIDASWRNPHATVAQRRCLALWATDVLVAGSTLSTFTDADGVTRQARLFPYKFDFSANPSQPTLRSGWLSGLGQSSVMTTLGDVYDRTHDQAALDTAELTFNSFLMTPAQGGFVTTHNGLTYLQEYMTAEPAYVLNGHDNATAAMIVWARRTGDPKALDLARRSLAAIHTTAALEEIALPTGLATSYDLLRGWSASPVRAVPLSPLTMQSAVVVDGSGRRLSTVAVKVAKVSSPGVNLLKNAAFATWSGGTPTGWVVTGNGTNGTVAPGSAYHSIRLTSRAGGHVAAYQDLPVVKTATDFTVAWQAKVARSAGKASMPGDVIMYAICGGIGPVVAAADVRSTNFAVETITGHVGAGCYPRVQFYQADGTLPSSVEFSQLSVTVADAIGAAATPSYPASVLEVPTVSLRVTYTGNGWLQAWYKGRWSTLGFLPFGTRTTATVAIPAYMQGRLINLNYDNAHVLEFNALYQMTGDTFLRDKAMAWLAYTPAMEAVRAHLNESVPVNPPYADVVSALANLQLAQERIGLAG